MWMYDCELCEYTFTSIMFDRIQEQPAVGKPSHHLCMNGGNQSTQAGVCKLATRPELYFTVRLVRGTYQSGIGDSELQVRYGHDPNPLSLMTIAQCQIARGIIELFQSGTLRAPLD